MFYLCVYFCLSANGVNTDVSLQVYQYSCVNTDVSLQVYQYRCVYTGVSLQGLYWYV